MRLALFAAAALAAAGCDRSGIEKPVEPPPHVVPPVEGQPTVAEELTDTVERFESAKWGALRYDRAGVMVIYSLEGYGVSFTDVDNGRSASLVCDAIATDSTLVNPRLTVNSTSVSLKSAKLMKADKGRRWIKLTDADGDDHLAVAYF